MKLLKLKLFNIGPYVDENEFVFSNENDHPITLIGGKNGAGKTTFLNSLRIGLFGNYALGRSENSSNYKGIKELFNYNILLKDSAKFYIEITIMIVEKYREVTYTIHREWLKENSKITSSVSSMRDGFSMTKEEAFSLIEKLKTILPLHLLNVILFDGEEIANLVNDEEIAEYLKYVFAACFNLNLFQQIEKDLDIYLEKEKDLNFSDEEKTLIEVKNLLEHDTLSKKHLEKRISAYNKELHNIEDQFNTLRETYFSFGGITNVDKKKYYEQILLQEKNREATMKEVRNFLDEKFLFVSNITLLDSIKTRIDKEKPNYYLNILSNIQDFLGLEDIEIENIKEKISKKLEGHNLSTYEININVEQEINDLLNGASIDDLSYYNTKLVDSIKSHNDKSFVKELVKKNEESEKLKEMLLSMADYKEKIDGIKDVLYTLEEQRREETNNVLQTTSTYEKMQKNLQNENGSFTNALKIQQVAKEYTKRVTDTKLTEIEKLAQHKYCSLHKKKDYVTQIKIDRNNFGIMLYDRNGIGMALSVLSAGEKQLLISALIWAIIKTSKREVFFVFDTPLARLDKENRKSFVKEIVCDISNQVIILSTNEEIIDDIKNSLMIFTHNEYLLSYNADTGITGISNGYFKKVNV